MKKSKYTVSLPIVLVGAVLIMLLVTCDKDRYQTPSSPVGPIGSGYDPVYSAGGEFVITYGMLDKRYNEITFPGTHNSYTAGLPEGTCENQELTITEQLEYGIRYIEFDLDGELETRHGDWCGSGTSFDGRLEEIVDYAETHPGQVITVKISDLVGGLGVEDSYHRINGRLENTGLDAYIYNWNCVKDRTHPGRCYIPDPWPTLREMIESGKNVMFIHSAKYGEHGVIDRGFVLTLDYDFSGSVADFLAYQQEQFCRLMPSWSSTRTDQKDGAYRLFYLECCPDNGVWAGDKQDAAKNNDGRRLYQVAKQHETEILPDNRVVNYIKVDYYMASSAGSLPIDVVDACNRLNYERFGIDWEHSECFWELYPYECNDSRVEHLSQIPAVQAEVANVVSDFKAQISVSGHEVSGAIVSTPVSVNSDWRRLPEWAVDNDMFTRWCSTNADDNHAWGIDLGERRSVDEIAIAWEYPHRRPGFKVYTSNDDSRFSDGISNDELVNDGGWLKVAEGALSQTDNQFLWDVLQFDGQGVTSWRYIKIRVTDAGGGEGYTPSFWEVRLYGPAN